MKITVKGDGSKKHVSIREPSLKRLLSETGSVHLKGEYKMNGEQKKKRKYWNDYLNNTRLNDKGEYSYTGGYYEIKGGKETSIKALVLAALMSLFSVLGGIMPASGAMETWYVIIPYALTVILSCFCFYYTIKWFYWGGVKLREHVYERTIPRLVTTSRGVGIAGIISLVTETLYLITHGLGEHGKGAIILIICVILTSAIGWFLFKFIKSQEWLNLAE